MFTKTSIPLLLITLTTMLLSCGQPLNKIKLDKKQQVSNSQSDAGLLPAVADSSFDPFDATVALNYEGKYYGFNAYKGEDEIFKRWADQDKPSNIVTAATSYCGDLSSDIVGPLSDTSIIRFDANEVVMFRETAGTPQYCYDSIGYDTFMSIIISIGDGIFSLRWSQLIEGPTPSTNVEESTWI
ncbi:MAG: hypothetical protein A2504_09170 [Bdellovibrionales bacterium RIFOXYD12_FULL_39_22]|nr:MAG: hypothetical protein A2385_17380 [Bdellovibrionales bacterium RIFOXYB1_FULL_39_21]OFZ41088.1 MAG: hypothetical protein A2485_00305 [Bdellovibrionales bacterium RIFOXYC12_FULL_39_17]OFZ50301.1 MAG: hypothetical protein A2404_07620 [Bdellovibrionales bacterium RIFOXYC1_FULL_39_130]OFZ72060.1 MAG: hypothetical protein A2451_05595 [Bdellovibrionales bacterium RIFOXYC2_FULL_39_8]OFZ75102.1 MAG: hypothetical protein A2560_16315 [Bdellovibrionales bacterium RIFOXYD1_FULL_39_84]OFZ92256.1 MAG: